MSATGPCKYCGDYPHHCVYPNGCYDKAKYINEVNEETPIIRKNKAKKNDKNIFYKKGKAYVYNKNGIPKEVPTR